MKKLSRKLKVLARLCDNDAKGSCEPGVDASKVGNYFLSPKD